MLYKIIIVIVDCLRLCGRDRARNEGLVQQQERAAEGLPRDTQQLHQHGGRCARAQILGVHL